jgi:isoquinoline 1-oxidoreductase alpha subunit
MAFMIRVNGDIHSVDVDGDTPLLWVLRDVLGMTGTKFGSGLALCGACTVHVDDIITRSCATPIDSIGAAEITTIEAIGATAAGTRIQKAWLDREVVQCGYCQSGQIMYASALLASNPHPTDADIDNTMSGNICRCGTPRSNQAGRAIVRTGRLTMALDHVPSRHADPEQAGSAHSFSQRRFLQVGAAAGRGLMLSLSLPFANGDAGAADANGFAPNASIQIGGDGQIVLTMPYVEMGQGTYTAIPMLIAEELEIDLPKVGWNVRQQTKSSTATSCWARYRQPATRMRSARRGSPCARPVRRPEPCWWPRRQTAGMSIPRRAARKAVRCFTCRDGETDQLRRTRRRCRPHACPRSRGAQASGGVQAYRNLAKRLDAPAKVNDQSGWSNEFARSILGQMR